MRKKDSFGFFIMKKTLSIYFLLLMFWCGKVYAQHAQEIKVLHEDQSSVTLEYTPDITTGTYIGNDGITYSTFVFRNAHSEISDTIEYVDTYRVVPLLLPSNQCQLRIVSMEVVTPKDMQALPIHALRQEDQTPLRHAAMPYSEILPLAEVTGINQTSVGWVGILKIRPIKIIDANHVKLYTKIVVEVRYAGSMASHPSVLTLLSGTMPQMSISNRNVLSAKTISTAEYTGPLANGKWYRFAVNETGMYKLDYNFFINSGVSSSELSNINNMRLYGDGGKALPTDVAAARPDSLLEITRLIVDKDSNGVFNQGDYIIFYGKSVREWDYDAARKTFHHYINPYSETNYYFFTFENGTGKPMGSVVSSIPPSSYYQPTDFLDKVFVEQELHNIIASGRRWFGKQFTSTDNTDTYTNTLSGIVANSSVLYRFLFLSRSSTYNDQFSISENGVPLTIVPMQGMTVSSIDNTGYYAKEVPVSTARKTWNLSGENSQLAVTYSPMNTSAIGWIDWLEILYRRQFSAVNDALFFTSPDTTAPIVYSVSNLSSSADTRIFDVSDHGDVQQVSNVDASISSVIKFGLSQTAGTVRSLAVIGPNGYRTVPTSAVQVSNTTLRDPANAYDFLIISPKDFSIQAERLRDYRIAHDTLRTMVVDIANIYNEFSSGVPDIVAIRDFLRYTFVHWNHAPRYILLFGWGHYDYKNITTTLPNLIPAYESYESIYQIYSYASDDSLVVLNTGSHNITMSIGRLPARTLQDATTMVDKIISYESTSPLDVWRNRITFVGDDGKTTRSDDGSLHTGQVDDLASYYTPDSFTKQKIYSIVYPTLTTAAGRRKPTVNAAIDQSVNDGTLILNYVGHGSPQLWSYESIFTQQDDLPLLMNKSRLTFLITATCDYAHYDDPSGQSAGEEILTMEQGGAAAVLSATRAVYSPLNAALNQSFYTYLFPGDTVYQKSPRLGDAMWLAKQGITYLDADINYKKYTLFADPTMRLVAPRGKLQVDSINGAATVNTVSIKSLSVPKISGSIKQTDGSIDTAVIQLFAPKQNVVVTDPAWNGFSFVQDGNLLYQGEVLLKPNGNFSGSVPIPKDVSFGSKARISVYGWGSQSDVIGFTDNIKIEGVDTTIALDTVGPAIILSLDGARAYDGMIVPPNSTLQIQLTDSSGINAASLGIGHNITATLTNPDVTYNLSPYYRSNVDTYKQGTVTYEFNGLAEGHHELKVKAWDVQNNSSENIVSFDVQATDVAGMYQVYNFPNPFSSTTNFTFQRNSTSPINVDIRIYSIAGRLIETLSVVNVTDRFVKIPWNGRDRDGATIANGVYLYKLIVRTPDRKNSNEIIGKLAIIR
jgi:Peptidase family C25